LNKITNLFTKEDKDNLSEHSAGSSDEDEQ